MKKVIKKIVGSLILICWFGLFFIMDVVEQGFLVALLSWILALVVVFLLMLAIIFLFADE